jgi:uncharacterized protein
VPAPAVVGIAPELLKGVYGGTKVLCSGVQPIVAEGTRGHGPMVQVVLPGAKATDLSKKVGTSVEELPQEIVMPVEGMVGVALAGLDQGEFVTIPSLPDAGQRQSYEAARQALRPNVSRGAGGQVRDRSSCSVSSKC